MLNMIATFPTAAFSVSLLGIGVIYALSIWSFIRPTFSFFPPPSKGSWQHRAFRALFRLHVYPLVFLTVLVFQPPVETGDIVRTVIGLGLFLMGFGMALRITGFMGWGNAFGEEHGLITTGWFARSRNPVYVATWVGLLGWTLIALDWRVIILVSLWALLYVLAPLTEEPWLEAAYGDEYRRYKARVARFL